MSATMAHLTLVERAVKAHIQATGDGSLPSASQVARELGGYDHRPVTRAWDELAQRGRLPARVKGIEGIRQTNEVHIDPTRCLIWACGKPLRGEDGEPHGARGMCHEHEECA